MGKQMIHDEYFDKISNLHEEFNKVHGFERFVIRWTDSKNEEHVSYLTEEMLQYLLEEDVLFSNSREYLCSDGKTKCSETIVLFVLVSDTFAYACADAEEITMKELPVLCKNYCEHGYLGVIVWAAKKRKETPIDPWIKDLKEKDLWDEELEGYYQEKIKRIEMMKKRGKEDGKVTGPVVDLSKKKSEENKKDKKSK